MALGGGTWLVQNKVLPGSYINFTSAARASATLSDRGTATMPVELDWGPDGKIFTVTAEEFQKNSLKIFGHAYTDDKLKKLRELFTYAQKVHLYKLNTGGSKASNTFAEALYAGSAGNELKTVIEYNEEYKASENEVYDVSTYMGTVCVDAQEAVKNASELVDNDYVHFKSNASLSATASTPLTGGTDGTVKDASYQDYLDKVESYSFNVMGCDSTSDTIKKLFAAFTKRMRDEVGAKFQTVLFRYAADYEGVISVENGLEGSGISSELVYWTAGAEAACAVNKDLTNRQYDGEYDVMTDYTQAQLAAAIKAGKFMFHNVNGSVNVLNDINTFITETEEKNSDFFSNQVIRVLDQIGNDIAALFNKKYLGKYQNVASGRMSLWNDIVSHHDQMQSINAIQNFDPADVVVVQGEMKDAVLVTDSVQPASVMKKLYMSVIVS